MTEPNQNDADREADLFFEALAGRKRGESADDHLLRHAKSAGQTVRDIYQEHAARMRSAESATYSDLTDAEREHLARLRAQLSEDGLIPCAPPPVPQKPATEESILGRLLSSFFGRHLVPSLALAASVLLVGLAILETNLPDKSDESQVLRGGDSEQIVRIVPDVKAADRELRKALEGTGVQVTTISAANTEALVIVVAEAGDQAQKAEVVLSRYGIPPGNRSSWQILFKSK